MEETPCHVIAISSSIPGPNDDDHKTIKESGWWSNFNSQYTKPQIKKRSLNTGSHLEAKRVLICPAAGHMELRSGECFRKRHSAAVRYANFVMRLVTAADRGLQN